MMQQHLSVLAGAVFIMTSSVLSSHAAQTPPWKKDVSYGDHPKHRIDIYKPDGEGPFPVIFYVHGGGWWNGDKKYFGEEELRRYLDAGVALVAIEYRFLPEAKKDGLFPPVLGPLQDTKRAVQFTRHHAKEWGLDPERMAIFGGSAGGFNSLWLALSPDMADPASEDPVERESTRVVAVAGKGAQTSIDPRQMREWVGEELNYGGHAFGLPEPKFDEFLERREEFAKYYPTLSPAALVSKDDPPIYLFYGRGFNDPKKDHMYYVHSPAFGQGLKGLADQTGVTCYFSEGDNPSEGFEGDYSDFLIEYVKNPRR